MSDTTVVIANRLFAIYKNEDIEMAKQLGKKIEDVPSFKAVHRFGMTKAKAIAAHPEELAAFIKGNS